MKLSKILSLKHGGKDWILKKEDDYSTLEWNEETPKPTEQELLDAVPQLEVDLKWEEIRRKRNKLLEESDYTQLDDSPRNKVAWRTYRQSLRDLPNSEGNPNDIVFPEKPE